MCLSLVSMLRRQDNDQGRIKFVNIASMLYDPSENEGILYEEAMEVRAGDQGSGRVQGESVLGVQWQGSGRVVAGQRQASRHSHH